MIVIEFNKMAVMSQQTSLDNLTFFFNCYENGRIMSYLNTYVLNDFNFCCLTALTIMECVIFLVSYYLSM